MGSRNSFLVLSVLTNLLPQGSNPEHTIYAFFNLYGGHLNLNSNCYWNEKRTKINDKDAGIGPY